MALISDILSQTQATRNALDAQNVSDELLLREYVSYYLLNTIAGGGGGGGGMSQAQFLSAMATLNIGTAVQVALDDTVAQLNAIQTAVNDTANYTNDTSVNTTIIASDTTTIASDTTTITAYTNAIANNTNTIAADTTVITVNTASAATALGTPADSIGTNSVIGKLKELVLVSAGVPDVTTTGVTNGLGTASFATPGPYEWGYLTFIDPPVNPIPVTNTASISLDAPGVATFQDAAVYSPYFGGAVVEFVRESNLVYAVYLGKATAVEINCNANVDFEIRYSNTEPASFFGVNRSIQDLKTQVQTLTTQVNDILGETTTVNSLDLTGTGVRILTAPTFDASPGWVFVDINFICDLQIQVSPMNGSSTYYPVRVYDFEQRGWRDRVVSTNINAKRFAFYCPGRRNIRVGTTAAAITGIAVFYTQRLLETYSPGEDQLTSESQFMNSVSATGVLHVGDARLLSLVYQNRGAAQVYLQMFDSATAPVTGATPTIENMLLAPNQIYFLDQGFLLPKGRRFFSGLSYGISSTPGSFTAAGSPLHMIRVRIGI